MFKSSTGYRYELGWFAIKSRFFFYILGQLFQQMGGLDVCLSFLKTCPSVDLKLQACQLMCNLSCNPAISAKCSENQIIPVMIGVVQLIFKSIVILFHANCIHLQSIGVNDKMAVKYVSIIILISLLMFCLYLCLCFKGVYRSSLT